LVEITVISSPFRHLPNGAALGSEQPREGETAAHKNDLGPIDHRNFDAQGVSGRIAYQELSFFREFRPLQALGTLLAFGFRESF
jgi:hypothetical protein